MKVLKKDGRVVEYREEKLLIDLDSSERVFGIKFGGDKLKLVREVTNSLADKDIVTTQEINENVEEALSDFPAILAAFREYKRTQQEDMDLAVDVGHQIDLLEKKDESIVNENGNKDSRLFGTQRELLSGSVSKARGLQMLPERVRRAHIKGQIHVHDLTNAPYVAQPNCCLVNFPYMFENGFKLGNAWISSPKNLRTAATLIPQVIGEVSASQYGGISVHKIDELLAPYAEMTFEKIKEQFAGLGLNDEDIEARAKELTKKEIYDAAQAMEYQINTMATSAAQVPFSTFSLGLGKGWFEKEIQKAILNVRLEGLVDGTTAIFPKLLYFIKEGHNLKEEDAFYDVKQLAIETSAKRTYPDMISMKMMEEIKPHTNEEYVKQNPDAELEPITAMGCVRAGEQITWRKTDSKAVVTPISELFEKYKEDIKVQPNGKDEYIDLEDIEIKDSHTGEAEFVRCLRVIKNYDNKWLRVKISNGRLIECTDDHPFYTLNRGRVLAKDLKEDDELMLAQDVLEDEEEDNATQKDLDKNWLLGNIICDGTLHANSHVLISYAMDGEDEIRDRVGKLYGPEQLHDKEQHRGAKGYYKEVSIKDPELREECVNSFRGMLKEDRKIPEGIFTQSRRMRVAFLGGMIDADGHINKMSSRIQIGSTSKELAMGQFMLMASLGLNPKVYTNAYSSRTDKIRYRIEANATQEVIDEVVCQKKKDNYTDKRRNGSNFKTVVRSIEVLEIDEPSYDVTTESDFFDVSGIVSHNCRSFLHRHYEENEEGKLEEQIEGRSNAGVVTINLPRIGIEARGDTDYFFEILEERLGLLKEALLLREKSVLSAEKDEAPILYKYGALGPERESVADYYNNKRATISVGFVGVHEAMVALFGVERWHENEDLHEFSVRILQEIQNYIDNVQDEFECFLSLYATPAESLASRFARIDTERYGVIENVTDKGYYENSFHYPSYLEINPHDKVQHEKKYPFISSAGFMTYVEVPDLMGVAGETQVKNIYNNLWDMMYENVMYGGVNMPNDTCFECGFEGEMNHLETGYTCVACGNNDADKLSVVRRLCGLSRDSSQ